MRYWKAIGKIIAYLKATKDLGDGFWWRGDLKLSLFADAGYVDRCNDRRSVSGVAVMLRNTAVNESGRTQHCVARSTREVEYVVMAHGAKTALAIKAVLDFVQPHLSGRAIDVYKDNGGAKALAETPQFSRRSKGLVRLEQVTIHSVILAEQYADILTKPLGGEAFQTHRHFLMNL